MNAPGRAELTVRLVADLGAAFHVQAAYASGHPQVKAAIERALGALAAWCAFTGGGEATLVLVEGHLLLDRQPVPDDAKWALGLTRALVRHGIGGLTLLLGLDEDEFLGFLAGLATPRGAVSTPHVVVGRAGLAAGESTEAGGAGAQPGAPGTGAAIERVEGARAEFAGVAAGGVPRLDRLRSLVARLARGAGASALGPAELSTAHAADREFVHGVAVAVAAVRLGRALGAEGRPLEDLALAALLHDVGYLDAPSGESPERSRALHGVRGAARLARIEGVPDAAVLVAHEHHLRVDRRPDRPGGATPRGPGAAARVVAVADTWVTLRAQPGCGAAEALAALRARAGNFLDPALVELFGGLRIARQAG
ncbi:MAG TPA: HD domain-containing protein [Anaeromyxobacteraceae bacterium]|nr:HD domain-containing protein [Anaeromyxobacteraceae bacterium]